MINWNMEHEMVKVKAKKIIGHLDWMSKFLKSRAAKNNQANAKYRHDVASTMQKFPTNGTTEIISAS